MRSNIRWCSDHFELACRNGEIVRVLFAIDACDREVMAWLATSAGISGEMVRDLMVACVERRFGNARRVRAHVQHAVGAERVDGADLRFEMSYDGAERLFEIGTKAQGGRGDFHVTCLPDLVGTRPDPT